MLHKLLTILLIMGLLISLGLWGATYYRLILVASTSGPRFALVKGCFRLTWTELPPDNPLRLDYERHSIGAYWWRGTRGSPETTTFRAGWRCSGFKILDTEWQPSIRRQHLPFTGNLVIPLWMPVLAFASPLVGSRLLRYRRYCKRGQLGLCTHCGYDLRGSQERCPECGAWKEKRVRRSLPQWACIASFVGTFVIVLSMLVCIGSNVSMRLSGIVFLLQPYAAVALVIVGSVVAAWFAARAIYSWLCRRGRNEDRK